MEDRFREFSPLFGTAKTSGPQYGCILFAGMCAGLDRFAGFSADIDYAAASPDLVSSYLNQLNRPRAETFYFKSGACFDQLLLSLFDRTGGSQTGTRPNLSPYHRPAGTYLPF